MNQRAGKTHKTASSSNMSDAYARSLVSFFSVAKQELESASLPDVAFYFEQMEEVIRDGKPLPTTKQDVRRALGL